MSINNFKFAIISDLHIALSHTILDSPYRFHQVEVSIPVLEFILEELAELNIDFLLLPGDLTQHGEKDNHKWLSDRLSKLPFPVYVVPGNHDIPVISSNNNTIGFKDFPYYYGKFGYDNQEQLYYTCEVLPGVRLIGLNSNNFNEKEAQIGRLDEKQLRWLKEVLSEVNDELVLVMIHHNILE
ncbi:MAG TPA: metallophosphoesterase, partial [Allocoleopsis sp.]